MDSDETRVKRAGRHLTLAVAVLGTIVLSSVGQTAPLNYTTFQPLTGEDTPSPTTSGSPPLALSVPTWLTITTSPNPRWTESSWWSPPIISLTDIFVGSEEYVSPLPDIATHTVAIVPSSPNETPRAPLSFQRIASGIWASYGMEKENLVINDPESFKELWQRAICTTDFCPEVPAVDFSEKTVIAIFAGVKPTLSHHIVVEDVTENDQGLTVQIRFADSSGGCIGLPALSSPYHILAVTPKTGEAKVSFVESLQVIDCMANLP